MAARHSDLLSYALSSASLTLWLGSLFLFSFNITAPMSFIIPVLFLSILMASMQFNILSHRHSLLHFIALPLLFLVPSPVFIMALVVIAVLISNLTLRPRAISEAVRDSLSTALAYGITSIIAVSVLTVDLPLRRQFPLLLALVALFGVLRFLSQILVSSNFKSTIRMGLIRFAEFLIIIPILLFADMLSEQLPITRTLLVLVPLAVTGFMVKAISEIEKKKQQIFRHSQELKVIQEISSLLMVQVVGGNFFQKVFDLINVIIPVRSGAIIFWESFDPDHPIQVFPLGVLERQTMDLQNLVESLNLYERAPDMAEITNLTERFWLLKSNRSRMVMPLKTQELYMGLLILESESRALDRFHNQEIVGILTDHLSISVQDFLLRQEMQLMNKNLQNQTDTLGKLLEISHEITRELKLDEVLNKVAQAVRQTLGFNTVLLSLYNEELKEFARVAQAGMDDIWEKVKTITVPQDEVIKHWSEQTRISKSFFIEHSQYVSSDYDIVTKGEQDGWHPGMWHPLNMLFIPLKTGNELVGYLSIDDPEDGKVPSYDKIQALEIFANQAVAAILSARNFEKIRQLSIRDPLTAAFNHRHFQEIFLTELKRHQRMKRSLCLAILDIDNFKEVNDSFGHLVGDQVLKETVQIIKSAIRDPMDTVFRYGGEEFTIIFSEMDIEKGKAVAERVRKQIEKYIFKCSVDGEKHRLNITVSIGLSLYPSDGKEKDRLIDKADQALYRAKSLGKNQVVIFEKNGVKEKNSPSK